MAPRLRAMYFDGRGRGELIRIILAYSGEEWEDVRFNWPSKEWDEQKKKTPYGQLPVLEVDGKCLAQMYSILRFLAKRNGLCGRDDLEAALVDQTVDFIREVRDEPMNNLEILTEPATLAAVAKDLNEVKLPRLVQLGEKQLRENGGKFLVGSKLTWADIFMYETLKGLTDPTDPVYHNWIKDRAGDARLKILEGAPLLTQLVKTVGEIPSIKKYMESRPPNDKCIF